MERYVNLECGRCGERLYSDLCDFKESDGSQPHLDREIYTNQAPDNLMSLTDVKINSWEKCSYNCSRNCHNPFFLIDAGTGIIDRGGYKYALACGDRYVRVVEAPKVALVFTILCTWHDDGTATVSLRSVTGECRASLVVEEPGKTTFGEVKTDVLSVLALAPDAVPKFVLENGLLLTDDDLTVAQIFA